MLLLQRPAAGLWGGLYGFIEFATAQEREQYLALHALQIETTEQLPAFRHTFSHFHLWIQPQLLKLKSLPDAVQEHSGASWFRIDAIPAVGLSAPAKQLFQQLIATTADSEDR